MLIEGVSDFRSRMLEELQLARQMQADLLPSVDRIDGIRARYGIDVAGSCRTCSDIRATCATPLRALSDRLFGPCDGLVEGRDCGGAMLGDAGFAESASRAARATTATGVVVGLLADFSL
jgi:hypothetical protein